MNIWMSVSYLINPLLKFGVRNQTLTPATACFSTWLTDPEAQNRIQKTGILRANT